MSDSVAAIGPRDQSTRKCESAMSISRSRTWSVHLPSIAAVLGFELTQRYGPGAAFISAGGYHHHIGLNTCESSDGPPPAAGTTGLYHLAILYPTRRALADALARLLAAGIPLDGASDHGVSEALYLRDPDDNGVELYWDRPKEKWPRTPDGRLAMFTRPLNVKALLEETATRAEPKSVSDVRLGPQDL